MVHELRITNQVIYLNPPIEDCRYKLYQEMFSWKMVILSLPRIQSQRYQVLHLSFSGAYRHPRYQRWRGGKFVVFYSKAMLPDTALGKVTT